MALWVFCMLWKLSNRFQQELKLAFCIHVVYIYPHTQTAQSQKQRKDVLEGSKYNTASPPGLIGNFTKPLLNN